MSMRLIRRLPFISPISASRVALKRSLPPPASAAAPGGAAVKAGTWSSDGRLSRTTSLTPRPRSVPMPPATAWAAPTAAAATFSGVGASSIAPMTSLAPNQSIATGRAPSRLVSRPAKLVSWSPRSGIWNSVGSALGSAWAPAKAKLPVSRPRAAKSPATCSAQTGPFDCRPSK